MNINQIATQLLTHFSPEERSIPDAGGYPGRNLAVATAMNGALQEVFGKGSPWVRYDERGLLLKAPATGVPITVTSESTTGVIPSAAWKDWFAGCSIVLAGSAIDNQIRRFVRLLEDVMVITGTLTPDATGILKKGPVVSGRHMWSTDGTFTPAATGKWVSIDWNGFGWTMTHYQDGIGTGLWTSSEDVATPDLVVTWTEITGTGTPSIAADEQEGDAEVILKFPHDGSTGLTSGTIYHDSLDLASDVLEVCEPVKANGKRIGPMPNGGRPLNSVHDEDFGFHRNVTESSVPDRVADRIGQPLGYAVETWSQAANQPPSIRMRIQPAPDTAGFLEYRAMLTPPITISDLSSTAELPIPFEFIQTIFLPIARQRLSASPFYRASAGDAEVTRAYQDTIAMLRELNPRKSAGTRLRNTI